MTDNQTTTRAWAPRGVTIKFLRLLINLRRLSTIGTGADIVTAAVAYECDVNTIHQAAHRLRDQGLPLTTFPPGPWNQHTGPATHYRLPPDDAALDQASLLLEHLVAEDVASQQLLESFPVESAGDK